MLVVFLWAFIGATWPSIRDDGIRSAALWCWFAAAVVTVGWLAHQRHSHSGFFEEDPEQRRLNVRRSESAQWIALPSVAVLLGLQRVLGLPSSVLMGLGGGFFLALSPVLLWKAFTQPEAWASLRHSE
jgi:hypothetical protein